MLINVAQNVKLEKGFIRFTNYSRQISVPFKIYADFERILKNVDYVGVDNNCFHTRENIKTMFRVVLLLKLCVLIISIVKMLFGIEGKNAVFKFIKSVLKEYSHCNRVVKKHFNKNLVMTA